MATYLEITQWVKRHYGFHPKSCWIAHCKELNGLRTERAWNRRNESREVPCPHSKRVAIESAFRHFAMI